MRFGIAEYGVNMWEGGCFDIEQRLKDYKEIGYEGTERLPAIDAADVVKNAGLYRKLGMGFATCGAPEPRLAIEWTAAFGKEYVWVSVKGKDFDTFCRQAEVQAAACARWGIKAALHNHLGSLVESQEETEEFLKRCPNCGLILDTAHLGAADGDNLQIIEKYPDRIVSMHLKDWLVTHPDIGLEKWPQRGRFCELGGGNIGLDNAAVLKALKKVGYDGWVFVEHDTHLQDPLKDLAISRQYIRDAGF